MKEAEIYELAATGVCRNEPLKGKVIETHISWIILSKRNAFKIKKPLQLSFLDFSTLAKRKEYCERELQLNSRFSDIYISVVPVGLLENKYYLDGKAGKVIDYAVQMKRMMGAKKMDKLLEEGKVDDKNILSLAKKIASFHQNSEIITSPFNFNVACNTFNDILTVKDFIKEHLGEKFYKIILESITWSDTFLAKHQDRFQERIALGYKRDVHGDLHSGNIFLYKKPVLFDCIEFDDKYRQIDVLYEIAFLCMDLESFNEKALAQRFLAEYLSYFNCIKNKEDEAIFIYFKSLRANIRAKVRTISALQAGDTRSRKKYLSEINKYLLKMYEYTKM
ncbi:MAG: hypothetical protein M3421_10215 [Bacteroidota bacterium]|nr:hypothetical protein [Bacteroidota bacterium]